MITPVAGMDLRALIVGDVHARVGDLDDCQCLIDLILRSVDELQPDTIIFLGDQFHTHALVNVQVQKWWYDALQQFEDRVRVHLLLGNHDLPGDPSIQGSSMQLFRGEILRVIDRPTVVKTCSTPFLMIPYMHDKDAFIKAAQEHPECPVAFAHQTFEGAKYENGFFAKDAINAELMPQSQVISGHIHSPAVFGKVWYPGSPRWLSLGDANVERHIHLVDFGTGNVIEIPTMPHLKAIWQVTDTPDGTGETIESLLEGKIKARDQLTINLQGPASWCEKRRKELTGMRPNIRFRTFLTDTKSATVRESEGLSVALQKHCAAYTPKHGTSKQLLNQMMSERIHV